MSWNHAQRNLWVSHIPLVHLKRNCQIIFQRDCSKWIVTSSGWRKFSQILIQMWLPTFYWSYECEKTVFILFLFYFMFMSFGVAKIVEVFLKIIFLKFLLVLTNKEGLAFPNINILYNYSTYVKTNSLTNALMLAKLQALFGYIHISLTSSFCSKNQFWAPHFNYLSFIWFFFYLITLRHSNITDFVLSDNKISHRGTCWGWTLTSYLSIKKGSLGFIIEYIIL